MINFHCSLSVVFQRLGLKQGQCIHIVAGNHHYSYLSIFAAWHLGAFSSTGDIALDEDTIAGQVTSNTYSYQNFKRYWITLKL